MRETWALSISLCAVLHVGVAVDARAQDTRLVRAAARAEVLLARAGHELVPAATTSIIGAVWSSDNVAVQECGVRLRDAVDGTVVAQTVADANGEFVLSNLVGGTFVVEVTVGGDLVAVGEVITIAQGETIATFVKLPPPLAWYQAAGTILGGAAGSAQGAVGSGIGTGFGGVGSGVFTGFGGIGSTIAGGAASAAVGGSVGSLSGER